MITSVTTANERKSVSRDTKDLPEGSTFTGTISGSTGLFLRAFSRVILLEGATMSWDVFPTVYNYVPVDIEIEVTPIV